ncbi:unnamed protein product, partial [Mesorhabditis belari]|uniref:Right handed beta helix domain-containing protein n=1 Tax=Mesorhabditis belari TaxID=2138241 RepID=A0AAF3J8L3_9BILA
MEEMGEKMGMHGVKMDERLCGDLGSSQKISVRSQMEDEEMSMDDRPSPKYENVEEGGANNQSSLQPTCKRFKADSPGEARKRFNPDNNSQAVQGVPIGHPHYYALQVKNHANPTVVRCEVHHGLTGGIYVHEKGVWIKTDSHPILRRNKIYDGRDGGVCIFNKVRDNDTVYDSATPTETDTQ